MSRSLLLSLSLVLALPVRLQAADDAPPAKPRRILYNLDGCSCMFLKKGAYQPGPVTEADMHAVVDELTRPGSQVDTLLVCINAQVVFYPSKVGTMVGSLVPAEQRAAWPASARQWVANLETFQQKGVDPYALIIARARQRRREVLLTYRMNDAHAGGQGSYLRCKLWLEHPEYRFGYGLDFNHQEVRDYTLRLIEEALRRYDCDGIELDFNRFPTYFDEGTEEERIAKINELVQQVRKTVDEEGRRREKRLVLAARVPTSYEQCRQIGLDPVAWANSGWIDFLTVSEFLFVSYDLPIAPWKKLITRVPVYGSIECTEGPALEQRLTPDKYRRAARHLWTDGADGVYLFNFFTTRELEDRGFEPPFDVLSVLGAKELMVDLEAASATHEEVEPLAIAFGRLTALCLHPDGNLLACDAKAEEIKVIGPDGDQLATMRPGFAPEAIDAAADGTIYCGGQRMLAKLDPTGRVLKTVELPRKEDAPPVENKDPHDRPKTRSGSRKDRVSGIAAADTNLFVAYGAGWSVRSKSWLFRYDLDLEDCKMIAKDLRGCCQRCDIVAKDGVVYVAENAAYRVAAFDRDGNELRKWGGKNRKSIEGFGACCNPMNLCFDAEGVLYTAESGVARVKRYSTDGKFLSLVGYIGVNRFDRRGRLASSCSNIVIAVAPDGKRVYVMDYKHNRIRVLRKKS